MLTVDHLSDGLFGRSNQHDASEEVGLVAAGVHRLPQVLDQLQGLIGCPSVGALIGGYFVNELVAQFPRPDADRRESRAPPSVVCFSYAQPTPPGTRSRTLCERTFRRSGVDHERQFLRTKGEAKHAKMPAVIISKNTVYIACGRRRSPEPRQRERREARIHAISKRPQSPRRSSRESGRNVAQPGGECSTEKIRSAQKPLISKEFSSRYFA